MAKRAVFCIARSDEQACRIVDNLKTAGFSSNDISVLSVEKNKLSLLGKTPSGGVRPTSVTVHDNVLYVLNAGTGTINGFRIPFFRIIVSRIMSSPTCWVTRVSLLRSR